MIEQNINPNTNTSGIAGFNQAYFQQIRLNEIFQRIDRCYIAPMQMNLIFNTYNYLIISNDLVSALKTIGAKLTKTEKEVMEKKREVIDNLLIQNPPHKTLRDMGNKRIMGTCWGAWRILNRLLLDYRDSVESLMEKYGFGNPSKKDPAKASIDF